MKTLCYALCSAIFIFGLVAFSQTLKDGQMTSEPARSYSVVTVQYRTAVDGTRTSLGERIRYVKGNGEFRQVRNESNEQPDTKKPSPVLAGTEEGIFAAAPGVPERKAISQAADQQMQDCFRSVKCLKGQMTFVRTDQIAGLDVYVLRQNIADPHPIEWIEKSYSPKTGYIPLGEITHFRDGSEIVLKATKVEFQDVPDNLNDDVKSMPTRK